MIKGNESLVENINIWLQNYAGFDNAIKTKEFEPVFLPISPKQHLRHPTHSSWSCHNYEPHNFRQSGSEQSIQWYSWVQITQQTQFIIAHKFY